MNKNFESADIESCRSQNHKFNVIGSDKTPMKRSIECRTCTLRNGKPTYVAYGVEAGSFGQWRRPARTKEETVEERIDTDA